MHAVRAGRPLSKRLPDAMKKPKMYKKLFEELENLHYKYFYAQSSDKPPDFMVLIRKEIERKQDEIQNHWMNS